MKWWWKVLIWVALASPFLFGCSRDPDGVILILVDTLRADHLGLYGYSRDTTPGLDVWSEQGLVFERAYSTSPWTLPSIASILTGVSPTIHKAGARVAASRYRQNVPLASDVGTLAEKLQSAQIVTGAIVNNTWLTPRSGISRGFDTYDFEAAGNRSHRKADQVFDLALAWLDENAKQDFFLLVHVFDPHMTYDAPEPFHGLFTKNYVSQYSLPVKLPRELRLEVADMTDGDKEFIKAAYDEEISFLDSEMDRFFKGLHERNIWKNSTILLSSDHGEEFFEHGNFEHGHTLHQELLHVPLIIWDRGAEPGRIPQPVSIMRLYETIRECFGIPAEPGNADRSLMDVSRDGSGKEPAVFAEATNLGPEQRAIIDWPWKLIVQKPSGKATLYNLEEDPLEGVDRSADMPGIAAALGAGLEASEDSSFLDLRTPQDMLDSSSLEQLKAHGYLD